MTHHPQCSCGTCEADRKAHRTEDPRAVHNGNDPAYSSPSFVSPNGDIAWGAPGLTKRELFAAMALQGLLSNYPACIQAGFKDARGDFEEFALMRADALLRELSK